MTSARDEAAQAMSARDNSDPDPEGAGYEDMLDAIPPNVLARLAIERGGLDPGEVLTRVRVTLVSGDTSYTDTDALQLILDEEGPEALVQAILDATNERTSEPT